MTPCRYRNCCSKLTGDVLGSAARFLFKILPMSSSVTGHHRPSWHLGPHLGSQLLGTQEKEISHIKTDTPMMEAPLAGLPDAAVWSRAVSGVVVESEGMLEIL